MSRSPRFHVAPVAVALLLAACSSDNGVAPQPAPVSLDAALSEMSLPALGTAVSATGTAPIAALSSASGCGYDAASGSFTCPTINANGLTLTHGFTLLDASGNSQSSYDRTTTAAVRTTSSVVGTITSGASSMHVDGQETMTLSGLLSGVHTLDGTSTMAMTGTGTSGQAESMNMTMTLAKVVLPNAAAGSSAYPLSGTMTMVGQYAMTGTPTTQLQFQVTFNGTSTVPMTMTMAGLTQHCMIDLSGHSAMTCS